MQTINGTPYGQFTVQVFGGNSYKFRMGYEHTSGINWFPISSSGGTATFQTGKVTVNCAGIISLALGGSWHTYASGTVLQLLPGTYNYTGACGAGNITVTAGGSVTIP